MSKTHQTIQSLKGIPREKWPRKIVRTLAAGGIIALTIWLKTVGAPWWALMLLGLLAGVTAAGEIVLSPFRLLGAAAVDLFAKFQRAKNGQSDPPSGDANG